MRIKHKHSNFFLTDGEYKSEVAIPFHLLYFSYLQDSMIPSYDCLRERTIGEERCSLFSKIRRESENKRESTCSLALADSCPRPIPAFWRPSLYECALDRPLEPLISSPPSLSTIENRTDRSGRSIRPARAQVRARHSRCLPTCRTTPAIPRRNLERSAPYAPLILA